MNSDAHFRWWPWVWVRAAIARCPIFLGAQKWAKAASSCTNRKIQSNKSKENMWRRINWIKWETLCRKKERGFRTIHNFNLTMSFKQGYGVSFIMKVYWSHNVWKQNNLLIAWLLPKLYLEKYFARPFECFWQSWYLESRALSKWSSNSYMRG